MLWVWLLGEQNQGYKPLNHGSGRWLSRENSSCIDMWFQDQFVETRRKVMWSHDPMLGSLTGGSLGLAWWLTYLNWWTPSQGDIMSHWLWTESAHFSTFTLEALTPSEREKEQWERLRMRVTEADGQRWPYPSCAHVHTWMYMCTHQVGHLEPGNTFRHRGTQNLKKSALLFEVTPKYQGSWDGSWDYWSCAGRSLSTWRYQRSEDILEVLDREASWIHPPSHPQVH